jgi:5-methylcytosine-specific restriction endonuclease McrA
MSDLDVCRTALKKLPKWAGAILLQDASKTPDKLSKKEIAEIPWLKIEDASRDKLAAGLTVEQIRSFLRLRNPNLYKQRDLDRKTIKKNELCLHLFDRSYVCNYRPSVTSDLRTSVWETYYGNVLRKACYCCKTSEISATKYQVGHVVSVANGGATSVENLRPICASCNSAMSSENMDTYMEKQNYDVPEDIKQAVANFTPREPEVAMPSEHVDLEQVDSGSARTNELLEQILSLLQRLEAKLVTETQ